ncbi:BUD13 homolog isoform X2 [Tyto alba]|uniref:BUD13 homolog isoform X2 n=1 Tax=Tyto alba TaxID=56313 RepID=UPI001C6652CD|nr:BUD13 homolog isoform X2 [Tyto alba]
MAAQGLSKAEYLRRYLSGPAAAEPARPRRRRRKKPPAGAARGGMRIVDDDVGWSSIAAVQEKEEEEEDEGDLPVVAEFIDERPDEVKLMEEFRTNAKWKLLGDQNEDSQGSDISVPARSTTRRQRHDSPDNSPPRRLRHDSPDKSPLGRQRLDSPDLAPPRRKRHDSPDLSPPRRERNPSPDLLPPRWKQNGSPDLSPLRRQRHDSPDLSPPRRKRHDSPDPSPPRRQRHDSPDVSPKRVGSVTGKRGCKTTDKLLSGGGREEHSQLRHGVSDKSSSRQKRQATPDLSPPRKKRYDSDADLSPPRRQRTGSPSLKKQSRTRGASPAPKKLRPVPSPQRCPRHGSESPSPQRGTRDTPDAERRCSRVRSDSSQRGPLHRSHGRSSDSDLSPPRRALPAGRDRHASRSPPDLSPRRHRDAKGSPKKASVMSSGVKAGLVSADVLRREQQELRRHERSNQHLEEESRRSETVFRDKSGRKRDLAQERLEQRQKAEAQSERDEQYAKWGKGLAQGRQQQQNVEDAIKEMQKPLARYIDDQDLDRMLREQEREGDPMADFIKKRKAKENKEKKEKPRYKGPAPPLNRFNIWPGHRWDGVDRSNGFEQQRFARIANKKAVQELAYKWSVEDM